MTALDHIIKIMICGVVVHPNYEPLDLQLLKMRKKKAAEMMGRFLKRIKSMVQGGHIMPPGWTDVVPDILEHADTSIAMAPQN